MINEVTIVSVAENQVHSNLDGESVILDLKEGVYFGLDTVGTRIWELLQEPVKVSDVIDTITNEYDVDRKRCTKDLFNLLKDLEKHNLLNIKK